MRPFSQLLDDLTYTRSRNAKLRRIGDYLKSQPDPDRGLALAALTDTLDIPHVKPAAIRALAEERIDPILYKMSRDYVGDSAETISLLWDQAADGRPMIDDGTLRLSDAVAQLTAAKKADAPALLAEMLDHLDPSGRYALIKLASGGLRVGVSARLAKVAFAQAFDLDVDAVEEVWHAYAPPFTELFDWAEGRSEAPDVADLPVFRPFMLAHPLEDDEKVDLADYAAEWKWDGIRVQLVRASGETRLYSRTGDDIGASFPDVCAAFEEEGVVDGELLVRGAAQGGEAGSFNALQQRLGRKTVSTKMLKEAPAFVRLYDILIHGREDVRQMGWSERRTRLESFLPRLDPDRFDLSEIVEARSFDHLQALREEARDSGVEGLMLKRRDSPYVAGRKVGLWYKWKRDPLTADCVMMYAQRGSGKRSSFFSDYTFGCWTEDGQLLPVGKAYFGFTDEELKWLDKFVRQNTVNRFGPVREVEKSLVLEVAFDSIHTSARHKSGLAMRFPRIARIRDDKPAHEADTIAGLMKLVT
ncbi:cisplatin damage response ATP-dependent DNA ligase [Sphingomicrobium aestuariivivum]|uniref:cisplatin damage response ATP-dependent DNA ligase n=1 Tax=Sphingomicrobium aestuariivivum TaxID=1582356 RepID=UPI001FD6525D|nr:cisplatin damage response ATP-dependent DNA ligase [Sphingomicrobium aestuariivivum]MCJ8191232.1 cisplatin damage response ATP-dependent DNA ligase [Sphingomicrobium aestuariivivum]